MKGKGKEDPHRRVESGREVLQIDYSYLKSDGSYVDGNQEAAEVVLTAADRGTGMFWAMGIPTKNFEKEYVVVKSDSVIQTETEFKGVRSIML